MVALSVPIFWRPESDGHGDDGCSTTFWRCHFFHRNGMLTPKDQYLFRWVETTNQKVWGTARCHGQPGTSLDLAGVWTVSSLSRSRLTTRQPEVGRMENVSFGRDFGTVTALYDFIIFCIGDFLKWGYPNSWMVSNGKKNNTVSHGWFYLYRKPPYELENQGICGDPICL